MQLIKRAAIALGIICIVSCSHYGSSSNESGRLRGNGGDDGSFPDQPQDGSLIVTPEGTKELKVEPIIEDGAP